MYENRPASDAVRLQILDCLRDRERRFIDHHSQSRQNLDRWQITEEGFFEELIYDLERYHIYIKRKTNSADPQRYQFVMRWDTEDDLILIHITLSPRGKPPRVKVVIHEHNTGHKPLPLKPLKPKKDSDENN